MAARIQVAAALAALAGMMPAAVLLAEVPAAAAVTGISVQDAVLVPGTGLNVQNAVLNGQSVDAEQFDVTMPLDIGVFVLAVVAISNGTNDPCQAVVYGQRWHCQPYPGVYRLMVQYQTNGMRVSEYSMLETQFPVTFTDTTTGVQAVTHVTVRPSTDLSTYVRGIFPPQAGIAVNVTNRGPSESSTSTLVITVAGTYVPISMPGGCVRAAERVTCHISEIQVGRQDQILIPLAPGTGPIFLSATVTAAEQDPDSSNNSWSDGTAWIIFPVTSGGNEREVSTPGPGATVAPHPAAAGPGPSGATVAGVPATPSSADTAGSPGSRQPSLTALGRGGGSSAEPQLTSVSGRSAGRTAVVVALVLSVLALLVAGLLVIRSRRLGSPPQRSFRASATREAAPPTAD